METHLKCAFAAARDGRLIPRQMLHRTVERPREPDSTTARQYLPAPITRVSVASIADVICRWSSSLSAASMSFSCSSRLHFRCVVPSLDILMSLINVDARIAMTFAASMIKALQSLCAQFFFSRQKYIINEIEYKIIARTSEDQFRKSFYSP